MRIKNPTDKDLSLNFKSVDYKLGAGVTEDFPTDVAAQWLHIYGFLNIVKATNKEKDEVVETLAAAESNKKSVKTKDSTEE